MSKSTFKSPLTITHIGTAATLIELDDIKIVTDPYFSPPGTEWLSKSGVKLVSKYQPALGLSDLPPIDVVLLSHEDHKDNLDDLGRQLLDGRRVVTTTDGANKLAPRPGITGLRPWETTSLQIGGGGPRYTITATPCVHLPGGECIGFVITADHFGTTENKPNALYFSGDTVHIEELAVLREKFHIPIALFNIGKAMVPKPDGSMLQITMDGTQAAKLARDIDADVVVPLHFEGWNHFKEGKEDLLEVLKNEGVGDRFKVLVPGVATKIF